jgi:hypothetical protein
MTSADRAAALATRWAAAYTRRLPSEQAERRRSELASDLWEQRTLGRELGAPAVAVALSILRRMVAGVPADLSWRLAQPATEPLRSPRRGGTRMGRILARSWWLILGALVAAFEIFLGIDIARAGNPGSIVGGVLIGALGLLILAGIAWRRRSRVAGDVAICIGALPIMPFFWLYVPVAALAVIVAATLDIADARSTARPGEPTTRVPRLRIALAVVAAAVLVAASVMGSPVIGFAVIVAIALGILLVSMTRRRSRPST